jgi:site-specific DNA recombinase
MPTRQTTTAAARRTSAADKGSLVCAHCGGRLVYGLSRGRNGQRYPYFFCISRAKQTGCPNRANIRAEILEDAVEAEVDAVESMLRRRDMALTKAAIREHFAGLELVADEAQAQQQRRITQLNDRRRELLELRYQEAIPVDLFRDEQDRLTRKMRTAEQILAP